MTEALLANATQATDALTHIARPVPIALVHRTNEADAFPVSWIRDGEDRFTVASHWPHDHPFYSPVDGHRHDPLLIAETMRQSAMLVVHVGYDIPEGYHFLLSDLEYACHLDYLDAGDRTTEVAVEVTLTDLKRRGGRLSQLTAGWVIRRSGRIIATGTGQARLMGPAVYRRVRGDRAFPGVSLPAGTPIPYSLAGRTRPCDVVLSVTPQDQVWRLRVDTRHSTLFQRPNDHVPGMLLFEAARQAANAVTGPVPFVPASGSVGFHRYAEFESTCWIQASIVPPAEPGGTTVQVTGHQDNSLVFLATLSAPAPVGL